MQLSNAQVDEFMRSGYLLLPELFSRREVDVVKSELPALFAGETSTSSRILEQDGRIVRSVYGVQTTNEICQQVTRHPRLLLPARRLLGGDVYLHQFKINAKAALGGDRWDWHQDYIFWRNEDGMPAPRVVTVAVYLDDVTEFNGPMMLLPGSHREGVIEPTDERVGNGSGRLRYALNLETLRALVSRYGICAPKGPAGTVLIFDANIVHGSAPNMSPFDRAVAFVTFNSTENILPQSEHPRPEFLAGRDFRPLTPVDDDVWSAPERSRLRDAEDSVAV